MKKYFIYILLLAYGCSALAVKPMSQDKKQIHQNVQVAESLVDDEGNENNDAKVKAPKKPTILDSWRKVATLNLRSLNRDDAWNFGKTATFVGVGYFLYSYLPKGPNGPNGFNAGFNPNNPNNPDNPNNPNGPNNPNDNDFDIDNPFGGNIEELRQQEEALAQFEQARENRIAREHQSERDRLAQIERDRLAREERDRQAQQERERQLQRQEEVRRQQQASEQAERERAAAEYEEGMRFAREERDRAAQQEIQRQVQRERLVAEQVERERLAAERAEQLRQFEEQAERTRLAREEAQQQEERNRLAQEEQTRRQEETRRMREDFQRRLEVRAEHERQLQQQEADELAEALRQSQQMEDERIRNASVAPVNNSEVEVPAPVDENQAPQVIVDPAQQRECDMCAEERNVNEYTEMPCCQYNSVCTTCLGEHLTARLEYNSLAEVTCPNRDCRNEHGDAKKIEHHVMRALTVNNRALFDRYLNIEMNEGLREIPGVKQCRTPDCNYMYFPYNENRPDSVVCGRCGERYCSHCGFNHAENMTCAQAERERDPNFADQENLKWIAENTKQCPNPSCNHRIQKNGGCNHMTCRRCNHEFCWTCLATYGTTRCNSGGCAMNAGFDY